jgi:hypothetical protein
MAAAGRPALRRNSELCGVADEVVGDDFAADESCELTRGDLAIEKFVTHVGRSSQQGAMNFAMLLEEGRIRFGEYGLPGTKMIDDPFNQLIDQPLHLRARLLHQDCVDQVAAQAEQAMALLVDDRMSTVEGVAPGDVDQPAGWRFCFRCLWLGDAWCTLMQAATALVAQEAEHAASRQQGQAHEHRQLVTQHDQRQQAGANIEVGQRIVEPSRNSQLFHLATCSEYFF